ncbi:MAG TPA: hypothetical protein VHO06_05435 [Polyangia bacterium]|nr:hypothetical protein [Polyangia bacterium]
MARRRSLLAPLGSLVLALAGAAGCQGAPQQCSCATASAVVAQPAALTAPIVGVVATAPCVASILQADGGAFVVYVQVAQTISSDTGGCQIRETLADRTALIASFTFARNGGDSCCASATHPIGPPPTFGPAPADGGT